MGEESIHTKTATNQIKHAANFELYNYTDFTILKIVKPWQNATQPLIYVLAKDQKFVPDSLQKNTFIKIPLQRFIATSTTHIPSIETLNQTEKLIGFPNLNYISSQSVRALINQNKIKDVGLENDLNTEVILDLNPDLIIGYGMDSSNKALENLKQMGIPVIYNADWTEETPLGKAEWIKFFGALFDQNDLAEKEFNTVKTEYTQLKKLAQTAKSKPKVFSGGLYQGVWYAPKGNSWASLFLEDANADYIWKDAKGTGSIAISIEEALDQAQNIPIWIAPGSCESVEDIKNNSQHNLQFDAFKTGNIYSFAMKKGEKGGSIFYELGPNRPDIILKDLIKILHPELLPDYTPYFYEKLK